MKLGKFHRDQKAGWSTQKVVLAGEASPKMALIPG